MFAFRDATVLMVTRMKLNVGVAIERFSEFAYSNFSLTSQFTFKTISFLFIHAYQIEFYARRVLFETRKKAVQEKKSCNHKDSIILMPFNNYFLNFDG